MTNLIQTKVANHYGNGKATRYDVMRDGACIGHGHHASRPFAPWTYMTTDGDYQTFTSRAALLAHVGA